MHTTAIANTLSGRTVLVATNHTTPFDKALFYNIYPNRVIEAYSDALAYLGANVVILPLESAIDRLRANDSEDIFSVVNVCAGFNALECEGIIQAIAALSRIACFPCRGDIAVISEEKIVSKHLAVSAGFKVARTYYHLSELAENAIYVRKKIASGDSKHVRVISELTAEPPLSNDEFIEPFVQGLDLELFCIFDPRTSKHVVLSSKVLDWSDADTTYRIHSTNLKFSSDKYDPSQTSPSRWRVIQVDPAVLEAVQRLGIFMHQSFVFRIDCRVTPETPLDRPVRLEEIRFLELNALPTIPGDSGWFSPMLFEIADIRADDRMMLGELSEADAALRLILLIWHRHYVQSKSEDGNS